MALLFPNSYRVAMGSLAFHQLYHLFNLHDRVVCERAVYELGAKSLRTLESNTRLGDFDIVAATVSYELDLFNLAEALSGAGISPDPAERVRHDSPFVLAGGVMAFMNPEPMAPLADAVAVGEAEALLPPFLETYLEVGDEDRKALLEALARLPGLYVPSFYEVAYNEDGTVAERSPLSGSAPESVQRVVSPDLSSCAAVTRVFTDQAEFADMALVELSRGCANACRFCAGAFVYRPPRWTPPDTLETLLAWGFEHRDKAGLVAASATDHPHFPGIRQWIRQRDKLHSVASLRLDQVTPELLQDIRDCGHKTLTLAPEAATERLREAINKPMPNRTVTEAMKMVGASDMPKLKLYLQVGLPTETQDDVDAVAPFIAMIKAALQAGAGKRNWATALSVSINPFVPKPGTPFQWAAMNDRKELQAKLDRVNKSLLKLGGVSVSGASAKEALLQGLIGRGDRRTAERIVQLAGSRTKAGHLLKANPKQGPRPEWYLHRERAQDEILPWDFIDHRVSKEFLWKEFQRALEGKPTPTCKPGRCRLCDACT